MKKAVSLLLLLALAAPAHSTARPIVEGSQVLYVGGTVAGMKEGTLGRLDTTEEQAIVFASGDAKVAIPYRDIQRFRYEEKLARRLGVVATIAVVLVKHRQRRHFIEIEYRSAEGTPQVAVFEVSKDNAQTLDAVLRARVPNRSAGRSMDCVRYPAALPCQPASQSANNRLQP